VDPLAHRKLQTSLGGTRRDHGAHVVNEHEYRSEMCQLWQSACWRLGKRCLPIEVLQQSHVLARLPLHATWVAAGFREPSTSAILPTQVAPHSAAIRPPLLHRHYKTLAVTHSNRCLLPEHHISSNFRRLHTARKYSLHAVTKMDVQLYVYDLSQVSEAYLTECMHSLTRIGHGA
jgi:hypothetical protein